jgi:hypothetical protein
MRLFLMSVAAFEVLAVTESLTQTIKKIAGNLDRRTDPGSCEKSATPEGETANQTREEEKVARRKLKNEQQRKKEKPGRKPKYGKAKGTGYSLSGVAARSQRGDSFLSDVANGLQHSVVVSTEAALAAGKDVPDGETGGTKSDGSGDAIGMCDKVDVKAHTMRGIR